MHYAVADYVLDIAQNAVEAAPSRVSIDLVESDEGICVDVADDGRGMDAEGIGRAFDPFFSDGEKHPGRKVGLGLPFLAQGIEQAGGTLKVKSEPGRGTRVSFGFPAAGPDVPPTGDVAELLLALACLPGCHELVVHRKKGPPGPLLDYEISRTELAEALGGLERADSLLLLRDYLRSQEEDEDGMNSEGVGAWQR
jgi:hypothetical protein